MPGETTVWGQKQPLDWTPYLIKRLRGKRTQTEFGALFAVPLTHNTAGRCGSACFALLVNPILRLALQGFEP